MRHNSAHFHWIHLTFRCYSISLYFIKQILFPPNTSFAWLPFLTILYINFFPFRECIRHLLLWLFLYLTQCFSFFQQPHLTVMSFLYKLFFLLFYFTEVFNPFGCISIKVSGKVKILIDLVCKKKGRPNLWKSFRSINQLSNGGTPQTFSHFIIAYDWLTAQIEKLP